MSKLHHQCPHRDQHPESACFFTGRAVLWDQAAVTQHSGVPPHNFIAGGKQQRALFQRGLPEHMVKLSLPWLARWLCTWRKAFFQQEQGGHTGQWQAQNSGKAVQAGGLAQKLCRQACQRGAFRLTLLVPLSINVSSTKERFVQI